MDHPLRSILAAALAAAAFAALPAPAANPFITVASTTSTEQSGLFRHLLPAATILSIEGGEPAGTQNSRSLREYWHLPSSSARSTTPASTAALGMP